MQLEEALGIARAIGDRFAEAGELCGLAATRRAERAWPEATQLFGEALTVADATEHLRFRVEARCGLAETQLLTNNADAALQVLSEMHSFDYPPRRAFVHLLEGLAYLQSGNCDLARPALVAAVADADDRLGSGSREVAVLETKGLALAGLIALGDADRVDPAIATFTTARSLVTVAGVVDRLVTLLDVVAVRDPGGFPESVRAAARGRPIET